ncbi:MAG: ABC transporter substrate-binding protein, partial [Spirochaetales bacterium]|nr:ABC transporter substrate-binding protein [Spirochaetales bacterium]
MKKIIALMLILLLPLSLFASGSSEKKESVKKDIITMAIPVDPDGLDPQLTASASTFQISSNIYETLITVDDKGELIPALASSWSVSEDGLAITFNLRDGAVFSNGKLCDAAAVKASFERLTSDISVRRADYSFITSIETPNANTIVFKMDKLNVAALSSFAYPWAAIVDASAENLRNKPVGTGPYLLTSWTAQQDLVLDINKDYPYEVKNEGVRFVIMPDLTAEITALNAKEVDLILITGDLASAVENKGYNIISVAGNGLQLMAMN